MNPHYKRRSIFHTIRIASFFLMVTVLIAGCRSRQTARVMTPEEADVVGSHQAGAETFGPLVDQAVMDLLVKNGYQIQPAGMNNVPPQRLRVCFVDFENASIEEMGDFKLQIYDRIDGCINRSQSYEMIDRRWVEAGLRELRIAPDQLFLPQYQQQFVNLMASQGRPIDCLLYASLTSGTTNNNQSNYQRDYLLTLRLINIQTGTSVNQQATLRKVYNQSVASKVKDWFN